MEPSKLTSYPTQTRHSPIIVGERYELAEAVAADHSGEIHGGLLAKPERRTHLLPMSGYQLSSNVDWNEVALRKPSDAFTSFANHNACRAPQDSMYAQYALPGQADAQLQPSTVAYHQSADQMAFGGSLVYPNTASYEASDRSYDEAVPRKIPCVSSYTPSSGTPGSQVFVYLDSLGDLSLLRANLMFGKSRVQASLDRLETVAQDACYKYVVSGNAPPISDAFSPDMQVELRVQLEESSGLDAGLLNVGLWFYEETKQLELRPSPEIIRKRKYSLDSPDSTIAAKRISPTHPPTTESQDHSSYTYANQGTAYSQRPQSLNSKSMQRRFAPYGRSSNQENTQVDSMDANLYDYSGNTADTQALMRPPIPQTFSYGSTHPTYQNAQSPGRSSTASFQVSSSSSPNLANPPLVRAISTSTAPSSDGTSNQYGMYTNRAVIKIRGDLKSMQDDWTVEEKMAKRRLVRFRGEQSGTTINTYFKAVKPDERPSPSETREKRVSCIYWEERDEYFVTSVDTIALLEALVGARFGVEEKNRIRRNLETHHPMTVSKAKADTESFFKVIMGFPNPKPRNIEKDVKVFPWEILAQALKKVISKYSPSPTSVVGPLAQSRNSNFGGMHSDSSSDQYSYLSSRSSTGSSTYASTIKSSLRSPHTASYNLTSQYSQASPLPTCMPCLSDSYLAPTLASPYSQNDGRSFLAGYTEQTSMPSLSQGYTNTSVGRRRSSDAGLGALGASSYPSRARANTGSFSSELYSSRLTPQDNTDYALGQLPSSVLSSRPSFDMSHYLRSESGSISQDSQPKLPSRQQSLASQYKLEVAHPESSQSTYQ